MGTYWSAAKPKCSSQGLFLARPPVASDDDKDGTNNAFDGSKEEASCRHAGKAVAESCHSSVLVSSKAAVSSLEETLTAEQSNG